MITRSLLRDLLAAEGKRVKPPLTEAEIDDLTDRIAPYAGPGDRNNVVIRRMIIDSFLDRRARPWKYADPEPYDMVAFAHNG